MKKIFSIFLLLVLIVNFSGCSSTDITKTDIFGLYETSDYFNKYFSKTDDWKKYSTSNYFSFSDEEVYDYSEKLYDNNGNAITEKYYNRDFGTFPAMAAIGYGKFLAYEFARQQCSLSDDQLSKISQIYPIYTSQHFTSQEYSSLDKSIEILGGWGGCIINQTPGKTVFLYSDRPADILFDPSGVPIDKSIIVNQDLLSNLDYDIVCYDSMVFFTNKSNTVNSLSTEQIRKIYSGEITNWSEVGGADMKIDVYHRGGNTMNRDYMEKVVMKGLKIKETNLIRAKLAFAEGEYNVYPAEYVNSSNAIGYAYKSLVDKFYGDSVKILEINGVAPTSENICSNKYPYSIPCLAITRKDKTGDLGKKVIEWIKSNEGKKSVTQIGLVPVT